MEGKTHADEQQNQITADESSKDTQIPPVIVETEPQGLIELIPDLVGAILTQIRRVLRQVPRAPVLEERAHIFATSLASRRTKGIELGRGALDGAIVQFRDDHTADETGERVELVEPGAPEGRDLRLRDGDTAKEGEDDDDERVQEHADEGASREGCDRLAERDREECGDEDHEKLIAGSAGG